jgi:Leucine-rich repeat (LRR) protein
MACRRRYGRWRGKAEVAEMVDGLRRVGALVLVAAALRDEEALARSSTATAISATECRSYKAEHEAAGGAALYNGAGADNCAKTRGDVPLMRRTFAAIARYRPRALTLLVLLAVAALIALANLSFDLANGPDGGDLRYGGPRNMSYGWPWIWRRYTFMHNHSGDGLNGGALLHACDSTVSGLAGNVAMWLATLAAVGGACEWLSRRYRLRLRWSLRSMLVAIGLVAALCGWFAAARQRADLQDSLIAEIKGRVWVERWGPKWLDLIGADRFRRRIIGAELDSTQMSPQGDKAVEEMLQRLRRLPDLQYLFIDVDRLAPGLADALSGISQLKRLSIKQHEGLYDDDDEERRISHQCLAAIGRLTQLEELSLNSIHIEKEDLPCLADLARLKSLNFTEVSSFGEQPLFTCLPPLPQLERIDLSMSDIRAEDLHHLAILPRLKVLDLTSADFGPDAGLADLASLKSLEDLTIGRANASAAGLELLARIKRLHALHINTGIFDKGAGPVRLPLDGGNTLGVAESEADHFRRAFQSLRQSSPGIIIDLSPWFHERGPRWDYDAMPNHEARWLPTRHMKPVSGPVKPFDNRGQLHIWTW